MQSPEEAAVRTVVEQWVRAVQRKDYDGILENHGADMLMFDVPPPLQSKGLDEYRHTWDLFFRWSGEPVTYEVVEMNVSAGADVAFVTAIMGCAGTETTGEHINLQFRLTIGLEKRQGRWTIVHEHHSIPATT